MTLQPAEVPQTGLFFFKTTFSAYLSLQQHLWYSPVNLFAMRKSFIILICSFGFYLSVHSADFSLLQKLPCNDTLKYHLYANINLSTLNINISKILKKMESMGPMEDDALALHIPEYIVALDDKITFNDPENKQIIEIYKKNLNKLSFVNTKISPYSFINISGIYYFQDRKGNIYTTSDGNDNKFANLYSSIYINRGNNNFITFYKGKLYDIMGYWKGECIFPINRVVNENFSIFPLNDSSCIYLYADSDSEINVIKMSNKCEEKKMTTISGIQSYKFQSFLDNNKIYIINQEYNPDNRKEEFYSIIIYDIMTEKFMKKIIEKPDNSLFLSRQETSDPQGLMFTYDPYENAILGMAVTNKELIIYQWKL